MKTQFLINGRIFLCKFFNDYLTSNILQNVSAVWKITALVYWITWISDEITLNFCHYWLLCNWTEHVHSQGIVLEDRSVLYKYLNPNLVAVIAEGEDNQQKGTQIQLFITVAWTGH